MVDQIKDDNMMIRPLSEEHARQLIREMTERENQAIEEGKN